MNPTNTDTSAGPVSGWYKLFLASFFLVGIVVALATQQIGWAGIGASMSYGVIAAHPQAYTTDRIVLGIFAGATGAMGMGDLVASSAMGAVGAIIMFFTGAWVVKRWIHQKSSNINNDTVSS